MGLPGRISMMVTFLYSVGVAVVLLVLAASGFTLAKVFRLRFLPPEAQQVSPLDVPFVIRGLLAPGLKHLLSLGFARPAAVRQFSLYVGAKPAPRYALVLPHTKVPAAAYVCQLPAPDDSRQFTILFVSRTASGRTLITRSRSNIVRLPATPGVTVQDLSLNGWPALWKAHCTEMRAMEPDAKRWANLAAGDWIALGADLDAATFRARIVRGDLVSSRNGRFRFGLRAALGILARTWGVPVPWSRRMGEDTAALASAASPLALKVKAYERDSLAWRSRRRSIAVTWLLFLATAVVAGASFGLAMDWSTLAALLAVLAVHELGHLMAMRLTGYEDGRVFFLPFAGAASGGRPNRATTFKELAVLFAGPVPGLVVGLAVLFWWPLDPPFGPWLREFGVLAVALNTFNLLPVHPLDGGRIFEMLLLSRWPWLAFAARVLGLGLLAAAALTIDDQVSRSVTWVVLILFALGLGHHFRIARLNSALRASGKWGGIKRREALEAVFAAIERLGYASTSWPTQKLLVDELLSQAMRPRMRRMARAGGVATYGFFLALPVLASLVYAWNLAPGRLW